MLRHLVKSCPHFGNSGKRQEAERELKIRTKRTKHNTASNTTNGAQSTPLAPLQIPNGMMPPSSSLLTPIAPGMLTPLPGLSSFGPVSGSNTLFTFDMPATTPGPSIQPALPLLQVDDTDTTANGPQNKRPRLDLSSVSDGSCALPTPSTQYGTTSTPFFAEVQEPPKLKWSYELQEQFRSELCMLLIATNTAWWAVDHPYVRWWFSRWLPGARVPGRKLLSGGILDDLAKKVENEMKLKVGGKFGTGQCDGWKNISKTSLVASMINVEYVVRTLGSNDSVRCYS